MTPTDNEALRENILDAVSSPDCLCSPAHKSKIVHDLLELVTRHTEAAEVAARLDELENTKSFGNPAYYIEYRIKTIQAELKAARPGSEGEG